MRSEAKIERGFRSSNAPATCGDGRILEADRSRETGRSGARSECCSREVREIADVRDRVSLSDGRRVDERDDDKGTESEEGNDELSFLHARDATASCGAGAED